LNAKTRHCPLCGGGIDIADPIPRAASCPHCHKDLHACHTCCFHDPAAHNQCREPKAEFQRTRDRGNFCDLFELSTQGSDPENADREEKRQTQLDDLFKNF